MDRAPRYISFVDRNRNVPLGLPAVGATRMAPRVARLAPEASAG